MLYLPTILLLLLLLLPLPLYPPLPFRTTRRRRLSNNSLRADPSPTLPSSSNKQLNPWVALPGVPARIAISLPCPTLKLVDPVRGGTRPLRERGGSNLSCRGSNLVSLVLEISSLFQHVRRSSRKTLVKLNKLVDIFPFASAPPPTPLSPSLSVSIVALHQATILPSLEI